MRDHDTTRDVAFDDEVGERPENDAESFAAISPIWLVESMRRRYAEEFDRLVAGGKT